MEKANLLMEEFLPTIAVGEAVLAQWNNRGRKVYYPAKILSLFTDDSNGKTFYSVEYSDGCIKDKIPRSLISTRTDENFDSVTLGKFLYEKSDENIDYIREASLLFNSLKEIWDGEAETEESLHFKKGIFRGDQSDFLTNEMKHSQEKIEILLSHLCHTFKELPSLHNEHILNSHQQKMQFITSVILKETLMKISKKYKERNQQSWIEDLMKSRKTTSSK